MNAHPDATAAAARAAAASRVDELSVANFGRTSSRPAPTSRDELEAQLRARLLKMIVANEKSRQANAPESKKPR